MDMNLALINCVKQCPVLYKNNVSLEERKQCWKKLEIKLQIQDVHLRSRWHLLLQCYKNYRKMLDDGKTSRFKYFREMAFLDSHMTSAAKEQNSEVAPEFVFNENDPTSDNEDCELVELSVERHVAGSQPEATVQRKEQTKEAKVFVMPANGSQPLAASSNGNNGCSDGVRAATAVTISSDLQSKMSQWKIVKQQGIQRIGSVKVTPLNIKTLIRTPSKNHCNVEVFYDKVANQTTDSAKENQKEQQPQQQQGKRQISTVKEDEPPAAASTDSPSSKRLKLSSDPAESQSESPPAMDVVETAAATVDDTTAVDDPLKIDSRSDNPIVQTVHVQGQQQKSGGNRCEDTIFGELISAMLKKMDDTKKVNVKRKILNLLFE